MTSEGEQWTGPGDTARRFGVTAKALRVYEREGLLKPSRTAAGWRVYGPEQFARLHLIVVLRDLGLPLKTVRSLLRQKTPSLVALLTVQQEVLEAKRGRIDQAISLLTAARGDLAAGRALSLDDLTHLSRETVMSEDVFDSEADSRAKILFEELTGTDTGAIIATLKGRVEERMKSIGKSRQDILGELRIVLAEGRTAMALGDPNAESVKAAVRRWMSLFEGVMRKDDPIRARLRKAQDAIFGNPLIASRLPVDVKVTRFLKTVADGMRERGELE